MKPPIDIQVAADCVATNARMFFESIGRGVLCWHLPHDHDEMFTYTSLEVLEHLFAIGNTRARLILEEVVYGVLNYDPETEAVVWFRPGMPNQRLYRGPARSMFDQFKEAA